MYGKKMSIECFTGGQKNDNNLPQRHDKIKTEKQTKLMLTNGLKKLS